MFFKRLLSLHMHCTYIHVHACTYWISEWYLVVQPLPKTTFHNSRKRAVNSRVQCNVHLHVRGTFINRKSGPQTHAHFPDFSTWANLKMDLCVCLDLSLILKSTIARTNFSAPPPPPPQYPQIVPLCVPWTYRAYSHIPWVSWSWSLTRAWKNNDG